jgi:hypothetical protein
MPASEHSLRITDAYALQLRGIRDAIVRLVRDRWAALDPEDLDRSYRQWLSATIALVTMGQREAVRMSDAYLAAYLSSELEKAIGPRGINPDDYTGQTRDGRPLREVFLLPLVATKLALSQSQPLSVALNQGLARAVRATRTEVMEASRSALSDSMDADERITGYRRVVHDRRSCGACLALAGQRMKTTEGLLMHASCHCTAEPIVEGVKERAKRPDGRTMFDSMTPAQQDRLFAGRGGSEKADLLRSGAVSLDDLVTRVEARDFGRTMYETPLHQLVSS